MLYKIKIYTEKLKCIFSIVNINFMIKIIQAKKKLGWEDLV